jgi:hypothetical protein
VQLPNLRDSGAFYMCPTREHAVRIVLIALIVTLGTLMTAAWTFVLGILAVGLIDAIFS